jgi:transcriptional regulator with XRE-family HTH domain
MNLQKIRKRYKMTQKEFASLFGYSESYYSNLERGVYPLTNRTKQLIGETLKSYEKAFDR